MLNKKIKPCKETCPKCGSSQATRRFVDLGERFSCPDEKRKNAYLASGYYENSTVYAGLYVVVANQPHIKHNCLTCSYVWLGRILLKAEK